MRATLEWATLLVCCAALLQRVPDAVRGRNRTVFGILLLGTLCSVLAVSELYEVTDGALGGRDVTSLILRYLVFATVLLGAICAALSLPAALTPASWAGAQHFVNYAAALGYVVGLVVCWFSGLIASPSGNARATLRRNND